MIVYFSVMAILGVLFTVYNSNLAQTQKTKNAIFFIAWFVLFVVVAFRYDVGTDYKYYRYNYNYRYADTLWGALTSKEAIGGSLLTWLARIIYDDYATWFVLAAVVGIIPCSVMVKKYSIAPCMSTILFVVLCCWHTNFNIVMQCTAIGVLAMGYRFLLERKLLPWCLICAAASVFHVTALMMIPVYFLVSTNLTWKRIGLLFLIGVIISLVYDQLFALMQILGGESMTEDANSSYGSHQLNILRVLVNCAPALMATLLLNYYDKSDKNFCLLYYMSLFNAVLNLGTMNSAYLNRFALYTIYYNVLFIPYLVKPFNRTNRAIIWTVMLTLYGIFWAYDLYKCSDTVVYQWIFQRGV